ncbi:MAG: hypothetical protein H6Q68_1763 [Firmicutes bacterium]|nr:hypothetical protein [Bacillota bacterium]
MDFFASVIFFLLVLGSSGIEILMGMKRKEKKILCIETGILGLVIVGGIFSIYHVPNPSIAKILGAVIPRIN